MLRSVSAEHPSPTLMSDSDHTGILLVIIIMMTSATVTDRDRFHCQVQVD
jgi:hypothetical protein